MASPFPLTDTLTIMTGPDCQLQLLLDLTVAQRALAREVEFTLAQYHGLSVTDLSVLRAVTAYDGYPTREELSDDLGLPVSELVRLLGPLQRIGVVQQESAPGGPKATRVRLTEAGGELAVNASRTAAEAAGRVLGKRWTTDDQADLAALLASVLQR